MTLRTMRIALRVSIMSSFGISFGISFALVISAMTVRSMMLDMRVMTNNMRAVMYLSMFLFAMCVGNIFTLLNIGGVYNVFTLVMFLMLWYLVALVILLVMTTRTTRVSMVTSMMSCLSLTLNRRHCTIYQAGRQEEN